MEVCHFIVDWIRPLPDLFVPAIATPLAPMTATPAVTPFGRTADPSMQVATAMEGCHFSVDWIRPLPDLFVPAIATPLAPMSATPAFAPSAEPQIPPCRFPVYDFSFNWGRVTLL